ncbi:MAG: alpha/beta hydrolase [Bacteroidia bacterium]|nr:alpha/beta hydrolase [Bacteroidia bacterium]
MYLYKWLKRPFFGRFMVTWRSPLSPEEQAAWEPVRVSSRSGGTIAGLFSAVPDAKATLVLGHPMGKEAKGYFIKHGYTDLYRAQGYNVLVFDVNGFGESSHGNFSYFEDIVAIGQKARELTPDLPIGYHGISLGGQWATIAFADPGHVYDFAIIESAATTLEAFWIHFPVAYRTLRIMGVFLPRYKKQISMVDRIREATRLKSVLFIYSETDTWTPVHMGVSFQANCPVPATLWTVPDAPHAMIMKSPYADAYRAKLLEYTAAAVGA